MSSQHEGINLVHQPHDAGYRLIELPMELEAILGSETAPVLKLESSDTSAVLRTPDRSYNLRQKNTSNAVFLISPHSSSSSPQQQLAAIATIHETVELDVIHDPPARSDSNKDTGSRGKWHEKFGRGR